MAYQKGEKLSHGTRVRLAIDGSVRTTGQLAPGQYLLSATANCLVGHGASDVSVSATSADVALGAFGSIVLTVTNAASAYFCVLQNSGSDTGSLFIKPLAPAML